jgi:hypothetical protein
MQYGSHVLEHYKEFAILISEASFCLPLVLGKQEPISICVLLDATLNPKADTQNLENIVP